MKTFVTIAALLAVGALTGAAGPAGPAGQAATTTPSVDAVAVAKDAPSGCFRRSQVRNHTVGGPKTLYLDVDGREVWKVEMSNSCLASAVSSDPLILRNAQGNQAVCKPLDLDITVSAGGPSRCIVSSIAKLSAAEVDALPKKMRP